MGAFLVVFIGLFLLGCSCRTAGPVPTGRRDADAVIMPVFCPTRQTEFVKSASGRGGPASH
jgi:hypothetical protein